MKNFKIVERLEEHLWLEELLTDAIEFGRCNFAVEESASSLINQYVEERRIETASGFIQRWAYNKDLGNVPTFMHQEKVYELLLGIQSGKIINDIE